MARIIGLLSFGDNYEEPQTLDRMAATFNFSCLNLVKMKLKLPGKGMLEVALVSNTSSKEQLKKHAFSIGDEFYIFDGQPEIYDGVPFNTVDVTDNVQFLAKAWRKDPLHFFEHLEGGCVGLRFDKVSGNLEIFRDRFGQGLLYYAYLDGLFLFATEIKALLAHPALERTLSKEVASRFLGMNYRMVFGRTETFFESIKELPLAGYLSVDVGGVSTHRYWAPPDGEYSRLVDDKRYSNIFYDLLADAVDRQVGYCRNPLFFVSGGLDAPVSAAIAAKALGRRVDCASAIFPGHPECDESEYVTALTEDIGAEVSLYEMRPTEFLDQYEILLDRHDQPLLSANYVVTHKLCEIAKKDGHDSVFGGGGGDLVTHGCLEYQPYLIADYYHLGKKEYVRQVDQWCARMGPFLRYWPGTPNKINSLIPQLVEIEKQGLIYNNPDWVAFQDEYLGDAFKELNIAAPPIGFQYGTYRQSRIAEEIFHQAVATHFIENINAAEFGLKGFDPLWDKTLIEYGFRLPLKMLLCDGWTKTITRQAMKGTLTEKLRVRVDKTGLAMPIDTWMAKGPLSDAMREILESKAFENSCFFKVSAVRYAYKEHVDGRARHGQLLWRTFAFWKWLQRWLYNT